MTHKIDDAVRETFTTAGTGDITLLGATSGVGARGVASALSNGDTTWMTFAKGSQREEAFVTYTAPATITRTTTYRSTNSDNAVDFGIGEGEAFIDIPAKVLSGVFNNGTGEQINLKTVATGTNFKTGTLVERLGLADTFLKAGRQGQTSPGIFVDYSAASCVTGLKIAAAAAGAGLALSVISSGTNEALTLDAKGSGTIALGGTSTGAITLTRATTLSAALTYGGVTLSNAVTGTGNMVLSASPTLTGTLVAAAATFSGVVQISGTGSIVGIGSGGTGNTASNIVMNGGSGTGGGASILFQKNTTSKFGVGLESAVLGSGSSDDFVIRTNATGAVLRVAQATGNVTIDSATASSSTTTGALVIAGAGGLGVGGNANVGGTLAVTGVTTFKASTGFGGRVFEGADNSSSNVSASFNMWNTNGAAGTNLVQMGMGPNASDTTSIFLTFYDAGANAVKGTIKCNGVAAVAYNISSDVRGKPNRERLSLDYARGIVDALEIYDFDKDDNAIRGIGVIAQQARSVHDSLASPGRTPDEWWQAEKAAPVPFLVAAAQLTHSRLDRIERQLGLAA